MLSKYVIIYNVSLCSLHSFCFFTSTAVWMSAKLLSLNSSLQLTESNKSSNYKRRNYWENTVLSMGLQGSWASQMTWKRNLKQAVFNLFISLSLPVPHSLSVFASGSVSFCPYFFLCCSLFSLSLSFSPSLIILPSTGFLCCSTFLAKPSSHLSRFYFLHVRGQLRWLIPKLLRFQNP